MVPSRGTPPSFLSSGRSSLKSKTSPVTLTVAGTNARPLRSHRPSQRCPAVTGSGPAPSPPLPPGIASCHWTLQQDAVEAGASLLGPGGRIAPVETQTTAKALLLCKSKSAVKRLWRRLVLSITEFVSSLLVHQRLLPSEPCFELGLQWTH